MTKEEEIEKMKLATAVLNYMTSLINAGRHDISNMSRSSFITAAGELSKSLMEKL